MMKNFAGIAISFSLGVAFANSGLERLAADSKQNSYWIPDARTASGIGKAVIAGQYGDRYIELFKRMVVRKRNGMWYVRPQEPFDAQLNAQEYEVVLDPVTGKVIEMHSYLPSLDN